jgi:GT2 family glycosyltransferase
MMDLAIIIVNWNVRDMLTTCLRAILADLASSNLSAQVWVVDNASSDGSVEMLRRDFPELKLIASEKNLGFAAGNNAALRAIGFVGQQRRYLSQPPERALATNPQSEKECELQNPRCVPAPVSALPEFVLLLNPDTEVHPGALQALFDFLTGEPKAGIAGAQLVYGDGSFQHSVFDFPGLWQLAIELLPLPGRLVESRLNGRYPRWRYEQGQPFKVGHPLGAAMCVRREAIQQVGLLDEHYHMYVEEVDWSKRIVSAGWKAYCVPAAKVTHYGGQSAGQIQSTSFVNLWTSRYQFYSKYYRPLKVWLASEIVQAGMRRKAKQDAEAGRWGKLTQELLAERLRCYETVINLWQGKGTYG